MRYLLALILNELLTAYDDIEPSTLLEIAQSGVKLIEEKLLATEQYSPLETPITELKLELFDSSNIRNRYKRAYNCLKAENINTIQELLKWSEKDLLKIPNFGRTCLDLVKKALKDRGLSVGSDCDPNYYRW